MSKKQIFEIPDSPDSVVFYAGREISIDGKTIVEVDRTRACSRHSQRCRVSKTMDQTSAAMRRLNTPARQEC